MNRQSSVLTLVLVACACGSGPARRETGGDDPEKQRVRSFWTAIAAATDARMRRDCAAAVGFYERALLADPRHEDALYYLGQCRRDLGRPVAARAAFERLVEVNPDSARGHLALGALLASPDAHEPIDLRAAEMHLRRAHAINGEETGPIVRLGEVLLVSGRADEALALFEAALRSNPRCVEAAFLAGLAGVERGRTVASARQAARVRQAAKTDAPVRGVLNEGDRKPDAGHGAAAPPLQNPLGKLLFEAPISAVRARAAAGEPIGDDLLASLWRTAQTHQRELVARARVR